MYETDSVPAQWVDRCHDMDEVWVPTAFHARTFAAVGVVEAKLRVLGEPVDVALFDAAHPLAVSTGAPPSATDPVRRRAVVKVSRFDSSRDSKRSACQRLRPGELPKCSGSGSGRRRALPRRLRGELEGLSCCRGPLLFRTVCRRYKR